MFTTLCHYHRSETWTMLIVRAQYVLLYNYPLWVAGLTLSHAGVSLQTTTGKPGSTVMQNAPSTEGIAHIVGPPHTPLSGLTPIVTPMTVVSQGNQVTAHILAPSSLAGKMITTPILKSVAQMPIVNAQYINTTTIVKPVVVVSSPSTSTPQSTTASSTQPSSTTQSTVWQNQKKVKLAWEMATVDCSRRDYDRSTLHRHVSAVRYHVRRCTGPASGNVDTPERRTIRGGDTDARILSIVLLFLTSKESFLFFQTSLAFLRVFNLECLCSSKEWNDDDWNYIRERKEGVDDRPLLNLCDCAWYLECSRDI